MFQVITNTIMTIFSLGNLTELIVFLLFGLFIFTIIRG